MLRKSCAILKILKIEVIHLKKYVKNMLENSIKFIFINYWRSIDKKILLCFFILFFLGLFFSFSSTSSLAGERLNKDYYFFFTKHFVFTFVAILIMIVISAFETKLLIKLITPFFILSFIFFGVSSYNRNRGERS